MSGCDWEATIRADLPQIDGNGTHVGGNALETRPTMQWIKQESGHPPGRALFMRPLRTGRNENAPARNGDCVTIVTQATWTNDVTGAVEDVTGKCNRILEAAGVIVVSEDDPANPVGSNEVDYVISVVVQPGQRFPDHTLRLWFDGGSDVESVENKQKHGGKHSGPKI